MCAVFNKRLSVIEARKKQSVLFIVYCFMPTLPTYVSPIFVRILFRYLLFVRTMLIHYCTYPFRIELSSRLAYRDGTM